MINLPLVLMVVVALLFAAAILFAAEGALAIVKILLRALTFSGSKSL